jgi:hypothetical protein
MSTERDTHFQGWARALREKIIKACAKQVNALDDILLYDEEFFTQELDVLIAQAGYDLAILCFTSIPASKQGEYGDPPDCVEHVPDSL